MERYKKLFEYKEYELMVKDKKKGNEEVWMLVTSMDYVRELGKQYKWNDIKHKVDNTYLYMAYYTDGKKDYYVYS